MNVAFNHRPQEAQERIEMVDNPEQHCIAFLKAQERKWHERFPDPEEIRALTQGMKRENWQIPAHIHHHDFDGIVFAYLEEFGNFRLRELKRFGLNASEMRSIRARHPEIKAEQLKTEDGGKQSFYSL